MGTETIGSIQELEEVLEKAREEDEWDGMINISDEILRIDSDHLDALAAQQDAALELANSFSHDPAAMRAFLSLALNANRRIRQIDAR